MKKKITELTVKIPLVTEEDLLHNELNMYLLYLEAGIFISNKDKEFSHSELDIIQFYGIINRIQSCFKSIRQALQIPFDMRSVIPAICGHSFFKYFYGCKVNVLIRHLGQ